MQSFIEEKRWISNQRKGNPRRNQQPLHHKYEILLPRQIISLYDHVVSKRRGSTLSSLLLRIFQRRTNKYLFNYQEFIAACIVASL